MESKQLDACLSSPYGNEMVSLLGSRGTMDILCVFCCGNSVIRFNKLNSMLRHISTKTLASRLRELELKGILKRTAFNEIPPRVEYSITEKGQKLINALMPLITWVTEYAEGSESDLKCCPPS